MSLCFIKSLTPLARKSFHRDLQNLETRRKNMFYVEQHSSGGFLGIRLTTNERQQQRSAKPLGSDRNMKPRLEKSFSARI